MSKSSTTAPPPRPAAAPRYRLKIGGAIRLEDGQWINPRQPAWQDFLAWVAEGNKPLPSDTGISLDNLDLFGWTMANLPWPLTDPVWQPAGKV